MEPHFSVGATLERTFKIYFGNLPKLVFMGILVYVPVQLLQTLAGRRPPSEGGGFVSPGGYIASLLLTYLAVFIFQGAVTKGVYEGLRGREFILAESLRAGLTRGLAVLLTSILAGIAIFVGFMALLVPGIILSCMFWVAVPSAVVDRAGPFPALDRSRELTRGSRWKVFGAAVVLFLVAMVVAIPVGILSVVPMSDPVRFVVDVLGPSLTGPLSAVGATVGYYLLRMDLEGTDLDQLVDVFE